MDSEDLGTDPQWRRRFDTSFTVWYKEDMAVFGWVKRLLGVKIDDYKIFEDGLLLCAIANHLADGSITREEVLYGSPLQRLELSVKAMHTFLGVAPVLDTCAVIEGRGQEELLAYLLQLKLKSDELEKKQAGIERDELWNMLMKKDNGTESYTQTEYSKDEEKYGTVQSKEGEGVATSKIAQKQTALTDSISKSTSPAPQRSPSPEHVTREDTYVVQKPTGSSSDHIQRQGPPPKLLKRSSLTIKLSTSSTPPSSPLEKNKKDLGYDTQGAKDIENANQQTAETESAISIGTTHAKEGGSVVTEDPEIELVTSLNELFDDSPNTTRTFPRSGFDRHMLYSPYSMPFISVREKNNRTPDVFNEGSFDDTDNVDISSSDKNERIPSRKRIARSSTNASKLNMTMMARMSARAPKGALSNTESDEE